MISKMMKITSTFKKNQLMISLSDWVPHPLTSGEGGGGDGGGSLNLEICLKGGQSFSWKKEGPFYLNLSDIFRGQDDITVPVVLSQKDTNTVLFWLPPSFEGKEKRRNNLSSYFRLQHSLSSLTKTWMASKIFRDSLTAPKGDLWGIRLLDQKPYETVISFICSQNNAIPRISKMVLRLKELYGTFSIVLKDLPMDYALQDKITLSSLPLPSSLVGESDRLREERFGYRAPYLDKTSKAIAEESINLSALERKNHSISEYPLIRKALQDRCPGIGPKVGDCIALMGLGWIDVVPIDVHMKRVAIKAASPKPLKSMDEMSAFIRCSLGTEMAGWAHLIMFANQILLKRK